jgi:hypothetical protein
MSRHRHPTAADLVDGGSSLIGTRVVLGRPAGRWRLLLLNRSSAAVLDWRFPLCVRNDLIAVAAGLARLHALTTDISSWCVPSGQLEVIELWIPTVATDRLLLDVLLADIGDPTGLQWSRPRIDRAVSEVQAERLVRDRRRIARRVVDEMAADLAGGARW